MSPYKFSRREKQKRRKAAGYIIHQRTAQPVGAKDDQPTHGGQRRHLGYCRELREAAESQHRVKELETWGLNKRRPITVRIVIKQQISSKSQNSLRGRGSIKDVHVRRQRR